MSHVRASFESIPGFSLIAPSIWEHTPPNAHIPQKLSEAPSIIVLCTWTGAQIRYIAKYTAEYQALFQSTRIMVITTSAKDLCFRNSKRKQSRLLPAVERIASYKYLDQQGMSDGILLHVFSEGGSNKAVELAEAYYSTTATRLPVTALCMDSTPGHPRYLRLCNALNKSLPQIPVLRHTGLLFGSAVLGCIWVVYVGIKGYDNNVITRTRRRLQDPTHFDLTAPRCYLYSANDALIAWQDVKEHATESGQIGMPITEVLFESSGHVGHAKQDPQRYWEAVMETWRSTRTPYTGEKGVPKIDVVIEDSDFTISAPDTFVASHRWSDADSQRTLLPGSRLSSCGTV